MNPQQPDTATSLRDEARELLRRLTGAPEADFHDEMCIRDSFKHFGTFYAGAVFTVMGSFVLEFFFSLFYAVVLRRVIRRNEAFHRGSFSENTGG